ncbi:MAG: NAD(P)/FAD-dependent oxidoreductase [Ilumatobacter sp.]|uniref:NAD(P)/FAD-dependent oxidoreductase n=1 Tax=Ilumatobacter sp. TaxID=1967498 RepID=UPI0032977EB8
MSTRTSTDVLVVGGGPAGCAAAIVLAEAGHEVTVLDQRTGRETVTRGDLVVPAAVTALHELDVDVARLGHTVLGTRMWHGDRSVAVRWPTDGSSRRAATTAATAGAVIARDRLDDALRARAVAAGADVRMGAQATSPLVDRGFVRGANVMIDDATIDDGANTASTIEIGCRFLLVADGANSRFGRGLGTHRDRRWPSAVTASTIVASDRGSDAWLETHLGPLDANANPVTGHAWVHPRGDGTLNIGVTVSSSYRDVFGVNIVKLLDAFCVSIADRWRFDPTRLLVEPVRRRTPLGGSVGPTMGPTFLVAGDAAGMANPFTAHGMLAALTTGRIAAEVLDEALTFGNSTTLQRYPARLDESFARYHKVGRLSARFLGRPWLLRTALRSGIRSEAAMGAALRIATNELRTGGDRGGAERAYRLALQVARFAPSW